MKADPAQIADAAQTLPGLTADLERFRSFLEERDIEATANLPDLLLSWASLQGDRAALTELERRLLRVARPILARYGDDTFAEDLLQEIRQKLLVGQGAKLRAYSGRGALVQYLKAVVSSAALDSTRRRRTDDAEEDDELQSLAAQGPKADSMLMHARYKEAFSAAFKEALESLTAEERTILRLRYMDGLTVEDIGRTFQVHRTTAMRRLEKLQEELSEKTREALRARLGIRSHELDGMMKELDLSFADRLSRILPALKR